jgi:phosphatidylethanolamine/phosphatidyl-N-methylethanolamine N-methyltransferase
MSWAEHRWNIYAPYYDRLAGFIPQRRRSIEIARIQPGERVLVCGCGTGLDLPLLPPGIEIDGVDLSPGMLELARAKSAGLNIRLQTMDAQNLAFPDATFDLVILHLIIAIVPDPLRALQEAVRVLKPAGRIALFDKYFHGPGQPRLIRRILNPIWRAIATDLNTRTLEFAAQAGLRVIHEEPAMLAGMFRIVRLERQTQSPATPA